MSFFRSFAREFQRSRFPTSMASRQERLESLWEIFALARTSPGALPPPLPSPARPDAVERVECLKKLRDDGAIDQQQFERMRDRIIAES
jgi:hypothetical protein